MSEDGAAKLTRIVSESMNGQLQGMRALSSPPVTFTDEQKAMIANREQHLRFFVPQLWVEALTHSVIQSLSYSEVVALCVHHENEKRVQKIKRRNTLTRRRRRAVMKREKRAYRDVNTKTGEG